MQQQTRAVRGISDDERADGEIVLTKPRVDVRHDVVSISTDRYSIGTTPQRRPNRAAFVAPRLLPDGRNDELEC